MSTRIVPWAFVFVVCGCVSGTSRFTPPAEARTVVNHRVIAKPFDEVWANLLSELTESFFEINNLEKGSGLINVSFSAPSDGWSPPDKLWCGCVAD